MTFVYCQLRCSNGTIYFRSTILIIINCARSILIYTIHAARSNIEESDSIFDSLSCPRLSGNYQAPCFDKSIYFRFAVSIITRSCRFVYIYIKPVVVALQSSSFSLLMCQVLISLLIVSCFLSSNLLDFLFPLCCNYSWLIHRVITFSYSHSLRLHRHRRHSFLLYNTFSPLLPLRLYVSLFLVKYNSVSESMIRYRHPETLAWVLTFQ